MKFEEKRKMITESKTQDERSQRKGNRVSIFMLRGKRRIERE